MNASKTLTSTVECILREVLLVRLDLFICTFILVIHSICLANYAIMHSMHASELPYPDVVCDAIFLQVGKFIPKAVICCAVC